jgi:hypothetical protein
MRARRLLSYNNYHYPADLVILSQVLPYGSGSVQGNDSCPLYYRLTRELRGQAKVSFTIGRNALICLHDLILLYRLSRSNLIFEPKNKLKV